MPTPGRMPDTRKDVRNRLPRFLAMASAGAAASATAERAYTNPLATPAFPPPGPDCMGPADPCVLEYQGKYFVYPTGDGAACKVMSSTDLIHWTGDHTVFRIRRGSPWKNGNLWAPEVERIAGRFYLYYTAGKGGLERQHIGVAESDSPLGPFKDRSIASPLIDDVSIDAECFQDGAELYLYYVKWDGQLSTWVRRLKDPLTLDPDCPPRLCLRASQPWEATVNEGPCVLKRDGKYYMFYSGNYAHTADYAVGVAVADHPMGPWRKQPVPLNPIFKRNDAAGLYGPGHGHHCVGPDGVSDWYLYHHKVEPGEKLKRGGLNYRRHLALDPLIPFLPKGGAHLCFRASGGSTAPAPRPSLPLEWSNFDDEAMPASFRPTSGEWIVSDGKLWAPQQGELVIARDLGGRELQDFQFEWWLKAARGLIEHEQSAIEFGFNVRRHGRDYRVGFRLRPAPGGIEFIECDSVTGEMTILHSITPRPTIDWGAWSRRVTVLKRGSLWRLLVDRELTLEARCEATCLDRACIRTRGFPAGLTGYRQTVR